MKARKICMIGDFAVGKTSLVSRFVHNSFSDRYLTTLGVKIDTKTLTLASGDTVKLVLWDIAGKSDFSEVDRSYLQDASGYLLVMDGTRPETVGHAIELQAETEAQIGHKPFCALINKHDLEDRWQLDGARIATLQSRGWRLTRTSALTGAGIEAAFVKLGAQLLDGR